MRAGLLLAAALAAGAPPAAATWSIAAVDPATREVGVAGASCIGGVEVIVGLAPGRGAVAAQAFSNGAGRDRAVALLADGRSPAEALAAVASRDFDARFLLPLHRLRQYGAAALGHAPASYTGAWTIGWAGARGGAVATAQGNLLRGPGVVEAALAAFEARPACPLAERLLAALEAGAARGGDRRCAPEQAALSAVLAVAAPRDPPHAPGLWLVAPKQEKGGASPVVWLRDAFDTAHAPTPGC